MRFHQLRLLIVISSFLGLLYAVTSSPAPSGSRQVKLMRTPDGGIQPQVALDSDGVVHMVFFKGDDGGGDIYYVRKAPDDSGFSKPIRVNAVPGSAIAVGAVRGAQLAVGRGGRVHVAWLGSDKARPRGPGNETPMVYTRLNAAGTGFEPERNVLQFAVGLDGGGSVAADRFGNVYVVWHGNPDRNGEVNRRVWVARSRDDGTTFEREFAANREPTGACGCCGMRAFADEKGALYILYRAATEGIHRDMVLLVSTDHGKSFLQQRVAKWDLNACPMSTDYIGQSGQPGQPGQPGLNVLLAWQTKEQVYYAQIGGQSVCPKRPDADLWMASGEYCLSAPAAAPEPARDRRFPAVASNRQGETLLAWTEGTAWKKGGSLAWQVFDQGGHPTEIRGEAAGVPVWGLVAAYAQPDGGFTIVY